RRGGDGSICPAFGIRLRDTGRVRDQHDQISRSSSVKCANKRVNSLDRKLPFDAGSVDFVLSCNVIYHGTLGDVRRRLAEIWRVLKPEALYQGTMLPTRNINYESGRRTRRRA